MGDSRNIRVLSLCTGYGGLELGLARALDRTLDVVSVEVECYAQAVICKNATKETQVVTKALWPDLKTFPAKKFRDCFDFILAGYPCQGESLAGKRLKEKDPRWLWPDIERIIKTVRPVWCFFENVTGHLTGGFPTVYRSLRDMGYKVEAGLFTAAEVGAPHKRERLFILANCEGVGYERGSKDICKRKRLVQVAARKWNGVWGETLRCSESQLANTKDTKWGRLSEKHTGRRAEEIGGYGGVWPARPGQQQYDWEEPRTIEPGVG